MTDSGKESPSTRIGWAIAKHQSEPHPYGAARAVIDQLHHELGLYRAELEAAGQAEDTVKTYTDRAERFIKWLEGKYQPRNML
jgi:hypothetical protein